MIASGEAGFCLKSCTPRGVMIIIITAVTFSTQRASKSNLTRASDLTFQQIIKVVHDFLNSCDPIRKRRSRESPAQVRIQQWNLQGNAGSGFLKPNIIHMQKDFRTNILVSFIKIAINARKKINVAAVSSCKLRSLPLNILDSLPLSAFGHAQTAPFHIYN